MKASPAFHALFAALFLVSAPNIAAFSGHSLFDHVSTADGLPNDAVSAIVQDSRGFFWIGTQGGLVRWDGYRFDLYENEPFNENTLIHNQIQTLFLDNDVLWVGTYGGLDRLDLKSHDFTHYRSNVDDPSSLGHDLIIAVGKDRHGAIWVGTAKGLFRLLEDGTGFKPYLTDESRHSTPVTPGALPAATVRDIHQDRKGRLWIATSGGGLSLYDEQADAFRTWRHEEGNPRSLPSDQGMAIDEDAAGRFWFGLWNGGLVTSLDPESGVFETHPTEDLRVYAVNAKDPLRVYVATWGGGLFEMNRDNGSFTRYRNGTELGSISHDVVYSFLLDESGDFWIGTNGGGLNRLSRNEGYYETMNHDPSDPDSLAAGKVTSIIRDRKGKLWVGEYNGGLNLFNWDTGKFVHYRHDASDPDSLPNDIVDALYEDSQGRLWIGTNEGLARYDEKSNGFVNIPLNALPDTIFYSILENPDGRLWLGMYTKGLALYDPDTGDYEWFPPDPRGETGPLSGIVYCMAWDSRGRLWLGTNEGLTIKDGDSFKSWKYSVDKPDGISSNTIRCMYRDGSGTIWLGTTGGGLLKATAEDGVFVNYDRKDGLPALNVRHIVEDRMGNIWVGTSSGLTMMKRGETTFQGLSVFTSLKNRDFHTGTWRDAEGYIYFGGTNALYRFNPNNLPEDNRVPRVEISDFRLGEGRTEAPMDPSYLTNLRLNYKENTFTVDFTVTDFSFSSQNRYTYFLDGFDTDWKTPTQERRAEYTNLPGGHYTLRVKGSNADGIWSTGERTLEIFVESPPYLRPWAWALYLGFLIGIGYMIAMLRGKKALAEKVAELTTLKGELEALNERLVEQNRIDGLTGISNRRHFDEYAERSFSFAERDSLPFSVLMIDLDYFKLFNDIGGHQKGDDVLRLVAGTLKDCVERTTDMVARYGGEEFTVILYDTDEDGARNMAERMRMAVWNLGVEHTGNESTGKLTISVGIATTKGDGSDSVGELIRRADQALYQAKENGRNRVETAN